MTTVRRLLAVMGSGETASTMVGVHKRILRSLGPDPVARALDTPYGFQENADDISQRIADYFATNVGHEIQTVSLRSVADARSIDVVDAAASLEEADLVFAGPGSPTRMLQECRRTRIPEVLAAKLATGGAVVFSSAAACTLGSRAVPVYEIYKVGLEPHWIEGFDLLCRIGLDAVVIPHYDNTEGGTHDTRYCYLGERRLRRLEADLPEGTWILGVDEHTAAMIDLDAGTLEVAGRGAVTVRTSQAATRMPTGTLRDLDEIRAIGAGDVPGSELLPDLDFQRDHGAEATSGMDRALELERTFERAMRQHDPLSAGEAVLELEREIERRIAVAYEPDEVHDRLRDALRDGVARLARAARTGMHDHRDVVAPYVEELLAQRARARAEGRYEEADRIRELLTGAAITVRDGRDSTDWDLHGSDAP